jgi:NitT/TauT family transport system permease protein
MAETIEHAEQQTVSVARAQLVGVSWSATLKFLLPAAALALFLFLWNEVPIWLGLHEYELPTFSQDMQALIDHWSDPIGPNLKITVVDALLGFFVGNLLAIIGAILFSQSKYIEWTFYPLAILMQTIPIIVIAPIMVVIFSVFGLSPFNPLPLIGVGSKPILAVTVLITFFPTLVNMAVGLRAIDPNLYDFMRLINASRWTILWRLRLPSSMPYLFSSFKITSTLCFVGAVVGEWMLANQTGIGGLLNVFNFEEDKPDLWAAVIAVSLSSMLFFGIVVLAERLLLPWREER